jgi:phage major head subunit gpT-like protein
VNVGTKGNIIHLSRQVVVNDNLSAFINVSDMLGRAARRSIEADVYAMLAENGGLGPTQADGQPLMHASRGNVDGTAGANSTARWDAMRVIMSQQMDVSGNDYLDIRPAIWLGPVGLGGAARGVNEAEYDDEATRNQRKPNVSRGLVSDIVDSPRLTGSRYYLLASPGEAPVFEVVFLDGQDSPFLDRQEGFDVDGTRWKVRLDYGVHAVDYRGIVTNAGQ